MAKTKAEPQPQWSVHQLHLKYPTPLVPLLGDLRVWYPTGLTSDSSDSSVFFFILIIIIITIADCGMWCLFMFVCEDIWPSRFFSYLPNNPVASYTVSIISHLICSHLELTSPAGWQCTLLQSVPACPHLHQP